jgi:hypothetical protein
MILKRVVRGEAGDGGEMWDIETIMGILRAVAVANQSGS